MATAQAAGSSHVDPTGASWPKSLPPTRARLGANAALGNRRPGRKGLAAGRETKLSGRRCRALRFKKIGTVHRRLKGLLVTHGGPFSYCARAAFFSARNRCGDDDGVPTLQKLLRRAEDHVPSCSLMYSRNSPPTPSF